MCKQKLFLTTDNLPTKNGILQFKAWLLRLGRCRVKPKLPRTEWLVSSNGQLWFQLLFFLESEQRLISFGYNRFRGCQNVSHFTVLSDFRHVSSAVARKERIHHVQLGTEPRETGQTSVAFLALLLSCCLRWACASGRSLGLEIISEAEGRPMICEH